MSGRPAPRWRGPWWAVLLTLLGAAIGIRLGLWQLDRATEKRELLASFAAGDTATALRRLVSSDEALPLRYQTVEINGRYDPAHQVLLDNLSYAGQPGYQVLTPLLTPAGAVLVNRGWVPASGDRRVLPAIPVSGADRLVPGRIDWLPRPGIALAGVTPPAGEPWPRRLLFPTSEEIGTQLGLPLRTYQLLLDPAAPDGYLRDWHPGGMPPERHVAYALQWFALALTVVVIYAVLLVRSRKQVP